MANVCDSFCNGCVYKGLVQGHVPSCNYIFMEDKQRPCPPGKGCTVKVEGNYKATVEERRSRATRYQRERRAANTPGKTCQICGTVFHSYMRKYCSKGCAHKAALIHQKEYRERLKNGKNS